MRFLLRVLPLLIAAASGPAMAQEPPTTPETPIELSLDEAVALAVVRSLDLQRAGYTVDLQALDLREAEAAGDPELSVSGGPTVRLSRGYETDFFGLPDSLGGGGPELGVGSEASLGASVGASLNLPLFDGGARRATRQCLQCAPARRALDEFGHSKLSLLLDPSLRSVRPFVQQFARATARGARPAARDRTPYRQP